MFTQKTITARLVTMVLMVGALHITLITGVPIAFAQVGIGLGPGLGAAAVPTFSSAFTMILGWISSFAQILLFVIMNMLQYLLQADFFNDPKMMSALNNIWILSRNIMNVLFALMLIGVAFYTIITANAEMIKGKWSQFVIAVVLVNFSWFFPRVIIDVANVLTATVYSVPQLLPGFRPCLRFDGTPCVVVTDAIVMPEKQGAQWMADCLADGDNTTRTCHDPTPLAYYRTEFYDAVSNSKGPAHAMLNGLASSFINWQAISQVPKGLGGPAPAGGGATFFQNTLSGTVNILMSFLVAFTLVLAMVGLAVGLFVRILILWVTIAFMPFTFLGYVLNGKLGTNVLGFEIDLWSEFINAAFLPAVVGIPIVIGFIMLTTVAKIPSPTGFPQTFGVPLLSGVGSWWPFMWELAAIAVIYIGAFTALARSKITGRITDKIKGFGNMIFGAAAQLPLLTPLPVGIGAPAGANLGTLFHGVSNAADMIKLKARTGNNNNAGNNVNPNAVNPAAVTALNGNDAQTLKIVDAIDRLSRSNAGTRAQDIKDIGNLIGGANDPAKMLNTLETIIRNDPAKIDPRLVSLLNNGKLNAAKTFVATPPPPPPTPPTGTP